MSNTTAKDSGAVTTQPGATAVGDAPITPTNSRGRVILASLIGTSIEFYDFYVYATAAVLVFPSLFFPSKDPATELLLSFATFGTAFVARPIGSVLFGHFGDRIGRKGTLVGSLLTMGIATVVIGLLPTAHTPGFEVIAPLLLTVCRFCQGLGLGGEWSGAALLATENAPEGKRAIYGTFPQMGAPIGFILANGVFIALSTFTTPEQFADWGWRVPFLLSAVLVIIGLWIRLKLIETPAFQRVQSEEKVARVPVAQAFKTSWYPMLLGTFIMLATYVLFYLMTTFTLTYGTTPSSMEAAQAAAAKAGKPFNPDTFAAGLGYTRTDFLTMLIVGVVFFGIFTLVAGPLAERFGRRKMLIWVTVAIAIFGVAFSTLMGGGHLSVLVCLALGLTLMGLTFGPMGALLPELFPTNVRYTGSAIAYNVSSVLGAAIAPFVFVWLWQSSKSIMPVGLYLTAAAVLTLIALLLSRETRDSDYEGNTH